MLTMSHSLAGLRFEWDGQIAAVYVVGARNRFPGRSRHSPIRFAWLGGAGKFFTGDGKLVNVYVPVPPR
jgi:hypothetical protein